MMIVQKVEFQIPESVDMFIDLQQSVSPIRQILWWLKCFCDVSISNWIFEKALLFQAYQSACGSLERQVNRTKIEMCDIRNFRPYPL